MKSNQYQDSWLVQSVTHDDGRRAIALWRRQDASVSQPRAGKVPGAVQRKGGMKLRVQFAKAELCGFLSLIRIMAPARRRVVKPPKVQLLNAF